MLLQDKVCLVTGATRGIGLAIAQFFAAQGAWVFVNGRDAARVAEVVADINQSGGRADPFVCDVADPNSVKGAYKEFLSKTKVLDVLVNNAGILDDALIGMVTPAQVERTFSINTYAVLYMSQYAARIMAKAKAGSIVNLTSIIGTNGNSGQAVYGGSKAAVIGITKSLAKELAASNIRVNAIAPGFIDTDMARSIPPAVFETRVASVAMKRIGSPQEIASVAAFLAADLSAYVTGQVIGVDGGMLI